MWAFFMSRTSTTLPLFKTDQIAWQSFNWGYLNLLPPVFDTG